MSDTEAARAASPSLDDMVSTEIAVADNAVAQNAASGAASETVDTVPDADAGSENGSENHEEDLGDLGGDAEDGEEQNLGDLGGEADDGDDSDPYKFIEKSLKYQDMLMTKRHCEERVAFFTEFAKSMPKGKKPHKKLELFQQRVTSVDKRINKFKDKYAAKRAASAKARAARVSKAREERDSEEQLGKPLKTVLLKELKKKQSVANKAAIDAVKALGDRADKKAVLSAGIAAFSEAFLQSLTAEPLEVPSTEGSEAEPEQVAA